MYYVVTLALVVTMGLALAHHIVEFVLDAHLCSLGRYPANQQVLRINGAPVAIENFLLGAGSTEHV